MRQDIIRWCRQCQHCAKDHHFVHTVNYRRYQLVLQWIWLPWTSSQAYKQLMMDQSISLWSWTLSQSGWRPIHFQTKRPRHGMFSRFGLPRQLHSDQGRNFKSQLVTELCNITGVYKTRTTAFHPRSDGLTERANRTILAMLRAAAYKDTKKWPSKLPSVLAAYRMTVHSTTGVTPNRAMHGREVLLSASLILVPPEENMPRSGYKTSRIIFDRHINKFVKPLEVQPKLKRPTLTAEPSVIRSSWVKWSGSTGQDHWYDRSIESSHECGRVLGL